MLSQAIEIAVVALAAALFSLFPRRPIKTWNPTPLRSRRCRILIIAVLLSSVAPAAWAQSYANGPAGSERLPLARTGAVSDSHYARRHTQEFQLPDGSVDRSGNAGKAVDELYRELMRDSARLLTPSGY
jgi:hypothetical protein